MSDVEQAFADKLRAWREDRQRPLRPAGQTADGRPLGATYGGDTTTVCGQPGSRRERTTPSGTTYVVIRCDEHEAL